VSADVADAGGAVAVEEETEETAYYIIVSFALVGIDVTVGTGVEALPDAALANGAAMAFRLLASWTFVLEILPAGTAIEATGPN
jgi:hypothetical protein